MDKQKKPLITVVIPCFNEALFIEKTIRSLIDDYVLANSEILIADANSTDGTRDIVSNMIKEGFPIRVIDNPDIYQVYGLNRAIKEALGEYVIRADAHAVYPKKYIQKCVGILEKTGAQNVGGVMLPKGSTPVQKAIALAMQHPVGVGDARFHTGNYSGYVDTVYLGAFRRSVFDRIGLYDTHLRTNEDAELNLRIIKSGGKIYLDSSLEVEYFPRASFGELVVQYFRYGRGRCFTTLKHKKFTSWRQLAPVLLVLSLLASLLTGFWEPLVFLLWPLYILSLMAVGLFSRLGKGVSLKQRLLLAVAFFVMHISWGSGFLTGLTSWIIYKIRRHHKYISNDFGS